MTSCERVEAVLAAYVGGELSSAHSIGVNRHLAGCPACQSLVREFQEVTRLAASLPPLAPTPEAADRILAALRAAVGRPPSRALDETVLDIPVVLAPTTRPTA